MSQILGVTSATDVCAGGDETNEIINIPRRKMARETLPLSTDLVSVLLLLTDLGSGRDRTANSPRQRRTPSLATQRELEESNRLYLRPGVGYPASSVATGWDEVPGFSERFDSEEE